MTGDRVPLPPDLDACPLLGLPNDPSTHFAFAHRAHLCHATPKPASIDVTYQARYCLTAGFPACDRYRAWAAGVAATAGPPPEPEMVGVMESVAARVAAAQEAAAQEAAAPVIPPAPEATLVPDVAFAPPPGSAPLTVSASPAVPLAASSLADPPMADSPMAEPVIAEPLADRADQGIEQPPVPEPTLAMPANAEPEVAEPPVARSLIAEPPVREPAIAEAPVEELPTPESLGAPGIPEPEIVKPPIAAPGIVSRVDRPAAWRSLAAAVERLSAARPKPTPVIPTATSSSLTEPVLEPLPAATSSESTEPVVDPLPVASVASAEPKLEPLSPALSTESPVEALSAATSVAPPVERLSSAPSTEQPVETASAATSMELEAHDLPPPEVSSPDEPAAPTWVAVPMETTSSSATTSIPTPIEAFLATSRAPTEPPSAPPLAPISVADEDEDDDHVADDAQGVEPPTDFGVWSTPEEEVAADDESAPWSLAGDGSGDVPKDRLAALNAWPAIQPLSLPEPRPAPPPARPLIGDDAWPPAPSLAGRSAGAATAFAPALPAAPRSNLAATAGPAATLSRSASAGPAASTRRPAPAPTQPVRPTLDAAALRRTRLPLLVALLAIAIIAGFAAGPWALSKLTGGDVPTPSAAGGALASAVPSAQPTVAATPAASAAASAAATPTTSPQSSARPAFYIVQKGDSLGSIAARFGTTVQRLMDLNHISNPNRIVVGQKILLPTN